MIYLALLIFLAALYTLSEGIRGLFKIENLNLVEPVPQSDLPRVSIIVPVCNEEGGVEQAVRALLNQDYHNLEIIVVNDRSTDATPAILKNIQSASPGIRLIDIASLPEGWLGKNHALHKGAAEASGDILLFTDGDVVMAPDTISRAVQVMADKNLDHLSLIFKNLVRGGLLNAMVVDSLSGLFLLLKPWLVNRASSKYFIGVGAFNMVRTKVYEAVGGHGVIRLHPIDDIMLGKIIKENGFCQDCLQGGHQVSVQWYGSVGEMVNGLMKNVFALYNYRITWAVAAVVGIFIMTVLPQWALFFTEGAVQWFFVGALILRCISFIISALFMEVSVWIFPWALLAPYMIIYIILRSVWLTSRNNGIDWRGTHYSLDHLRQAEPLLTVAWLFS